MGNPGDHLIVLTPMKTHCLVVDSSKESLIANVMKFLKPACDLFRQHRVALEKRISRIREH